MLQRLPKALAQVQVGNNSNSLLNEFRQIVYSLYQSKEITENVYNDINIIFNIINIFYKQNIKMDTIFMNSENSKTSKPHVLIRNLTDKIDSTRDEKV